MPGRRTVAFAALVLGWILASPESLAGAQDTTKISPPPPASVPVLSADVPREVLAPRGRFTFTQDSVHWSSAVSLGDLLANIPGVYVARAGFLGHPAYVAYAGRGAATLELYRDGLPVIPLGGDSAFIDPARILLTTFERVDVEVLPGQLRVYLVSRRHETVDSRSYVAIMSGDFSTAEYTGQFQRRWRQGLGLHLGADFLNSNGAPASNRSDQAFEAWARVEWIPRDNVGAMYQLRRQDDDHDPLADLTGTTPSRRGTRTDAQLRLFAAARPDRRGLSGTFDLASQSWTDDSVVADRVMRLAVTRVRYETPALSAEFTGLLSDGVTRRSIEARAGWTPFAGVALAGNARASRYIGDRTGTRAHGSVTLYYGPFSVVGEGSYFHEPQAPAIRSDTARRVIDRAVRVAFDSKALSASGGIVRRGAYDPLPFRDLRAIPFATAVPKSTYYVGTVRLRPIPPITLETWYLNPVEGGADFQPPHHARSAITFRSKFWRTFRSGAFDLKVQIAVESWSQGIAGRTAGGAPIALDGLTFTETYLAFQIVGFTAFWDLRNAWNTRNNYVPGFADYPRNAQTFGVKWEFRN